MNNSVSVPFDELKKGDIFSLAEDSNLNYKNMYIKLSGDYYSNRVVAVCLNTGNCECFYGEEECVLEKSVEDKGVSVTI